MPSSVETNVALLRGASTGDMHTVKTALAAGANVSGSPELPFTPIMAAAVENDLVIINFLIKQGADPDRPATLGPSCCRSRLERYMMPGERALHMAAKRGSVETTRSLLHRARADPNATDKKGCTPLLTACAFECNNADLVRLLLEAGADPTLADEDGVTPLHMVAKFDLVDLFDMLYSGAPATLNSPTVEGHMPLFMASARGHETMVSRLLSQGATHRMPLGEIYCPTPLVAATVGGFVEVVRVLINEGIEAVGGRRNFPLTLYSAVNCSQPRILLLLLAVGGEEMRSLWANSGTDGRPLLHHGAAYGYPAVVSVLLAAGADEAIRDSEGRIPRDDIGVELEQRVQMDRGMEVAIRRMLAQGPAYRARSWAWPAAEVHGGGCGDGGAVVSPPPAAPKAPVSVRIFRPKDDRKFFASLVGRYCEKD